MAIVNLIGIEVLTIISTTGIVPDGYKNINFVNTGAADATLTQNGKTWTLPSGAVFNLNSTRMTDAWLSVAIDASTTTVIATYY